MIPWWGWLIISIAGFTAALYIIYIILAVMFVRWFKNDWL